MDWEGNGRPRWHFNEWHGLVAMFLVTLALLALVAIGEATPTATWHPVPSPSPSVTGGR